MIIKNGFIYLSGYKGIEILKFDDPHSPLPIPNLPGLDLNYPTKTFVEDNLLYRLEIQNFEIWDIKDAFNPILIFKSQNSSFEDFVVSSKIVYFINTKDLEIWGFSDISNPLLIGPFQIHIVPNILMSFVI